MPENKGLSDNLKEILTDSTGENPVNKYIIRPIEAQIAKGIKSDKRDYVSELADAAPAIGSVAGPQGAIVGILAQKLIDELSGKPKRSIQEDIVNMAMAPGGFKEGFIGHSLSEPEYAALSSKLRRMSEEEQINYLKNNVPIDIAHDYTQHPEFSQSASKAIIQKSIGGLSEPEVIPGSKKMVAEEVHQNIKDLDLANRLEADRYANKMRGQSLEGSALEKYNELANRTSLQSLLGLKGESMENVSKQYSYLKELFKNDPEAMRILNESTPEDIKGIGRIIREK